MVSPGHNTAFAFNKCLRCFICTSVDSKYVGLGLNFIEVPVFLNPTSPTSLRSLALSPLLKDISYSFESLLTVTSSLSDKAFTTETPTPCKPPEKL